MNKGQNFLKQKTDTFAACAPGGIRTPNNGSEDRCDIHFTMGAIAVYYTRIAK